MNTYSSKLMPPGPVGSPADRHLSKRAGDRLQQFPGAYLAEDVRVVRGADVPSTMLRKDNGRETH